MSNFISTLFELLGAGFDKIPVIGKIKGTRSILGFVGLAIVAGLQAYGIGSPEILGYVKDGLLVFTGLSLLAKPRLNQ